MAFRWRVLLMLLTIDRLRVYVKAQCDVRVPAESPWPEIVYVPHNANVYINCTLEGQSTPFWEIRLADFTTDLRFSDEANQRQTLKDRGVCNLSLIQGMPPILRLLVNKTEVNNNTVIRCSDLRNDDRQTTLYLYETSTLILQAEDLDEKQSLNISWFDPHDSNMTYNLTVINSANQQLEFILQKTHHIFTAPRGAPPCDVYNFSVTATYVGATYAGAGCYSSESSPVLITMLPSLPNISQLESSLEYELKKEATELVLRISYEPASYCENYPITNYTLEVNNTLNEEILLSVFAPSAKTLTVRGGLSENAGYSFRILVANTVGIVPTIDRQFKTTDVQAVTATFIDSANMSTILCEFVSGSNAIGCMVVLTSGGQEATYNLTKSETVNCSILTVTVEFAQSHVDQVEAFDIEANGAVSSFAIPGLLSNLLPTSCTPIDTSTLKPPSSMNPLWVYIMVVIGIVTVLTVLVLFVLSVAICRYRSRSGKSSFFCCCKYHSSILERQGNIISIAFQLREQDVNDGLENESISEQTSSTDQIRSKSKKPTSAKGGNEGAENVSPTNTKQEQSDIGDYVKKECYYCEIPQITVPEKDVAEDVAICEGEYACADCTTPREPIRKDTCSLRQNEEKSGLPFETHLHNQPQASTTHLIEEACSGGSKSETKGASTTSTLGSGYKELVGEHGNSYVPQEALYDQPIAVKARTPGDGADHNKSRKALSTTNCEESEGHTYFTLEPGGVSHGITTSRFNNSDAQKTPQPGGNVSALPIYHEIKDIAPTNKRKAAAKPATNNGEITPSTSLPNSNPS